MRLKRSIADTMMQYIVKNDNQPCDSYTDPILVLCRDASRPTVNRVAAAGLLQMGCTGRLVAHQEGKNLVQSIIADDIPRPLIEFGALHARPYGTRFVILHFGAILEIYHRRTKLKQDTDHRSQQMKAEEFTTDP